MSLYKPEDFHRYYINGISSCSVEQAVEAANAKRDDELERMTKALREAREILETFDSCLDSECKFSLGSVLHDNTKAWLKKYGEEK